VRRGLLGGTFDPPHLVHLIAGDAALRQLGLDEVTFLPAGAPWQKAGRDVSDAAHRWEMTRAAVEGVEGFEADDREVRRDGWTYTIDTIEQFPDDDLVLILGADAAAGLPTWHRADEVIAAAQVAVVPRPGVERAAVEATGARITWLDVPELAVSGTMLRARRRAGLGIRFFVTEGVHRYVVEHGLYAPEAR
jgi:nicotinate-nucleotide adenylyltransferase